MKPAIETIRLSEKEKKQLIALKRRTGIDNWNILCRWAFCVSLAEPTKPPREDIPSDSSVEMSWKVFSGSHSEIYTCLIKQRAQTDGVELNLDNTYSYFRSYLNRGISYLSNKNILSVVDFLELS